MKLVVFATVLVSALSLTASAATLTFEDGTINGSTTYIPNFPENFTTFEQNGILVSTSSSTNAQVGNYYGGPMGGGESNSVVHWHGVGHTIRFSMANGENFSLESLVLNANVMMGGSPMTSGTEVSYLVASTGESILLPPTGWNVPVTLQFPTLTNISHFDIVTETDIGCIGVDDVTVASAVPEPSAALLGALGGLFLFRRRR